MIPTQWIPIEMTIVHSRAYAMEEDNVSFVDAMRCVHEYPVLLDDVWLFSLRGAYEWDLLGPGVGKLERKRGRLENI